MRPARRGGPGPLDLGGGVWVFSSPGFADQLSTLISLGEEALIVDPPMFPEEAGRIREFAHGRGLRVEWLVITHAHGDHAYGMVFFPEARVIAQREFWPFWRLAREVEAEYFERALPGFSPPPLREPNIVFARELTLKLGGRVVRLEHLPGHSPDGLMLELPGEGIWIVGDSVIPIPYLASGDRRELIARLRGLLVRWRGQTIVMGHDAVLSREQARAAILGNIRYLERLGAAVGEIISRGGTLKEALALPLSEFGVPEASIGGLAAQLHRVNLERAFEELLPERG